MVRVTNRVSAFAMLILAAAADAPQEEHAAMMQLQGSSKQLEHEVSNHEKPQPKDLLLFSWRITPDTPDFVKKAALIFEDNLKTRSVESPIAKGDALEVGTVEKRSDQIANSFGVEAGYKCFTSSVNTATERIQSSNVEKFRADHTIQNTVEEIYQDNKINPGANLRLDIKQFMMTKTPPEIVEELGEFYAHSITFGGMFRSTHVVAKSEFASEDSFKTEISLKVESFAKAATKAETSGKKTSTDKSTHISSSTVAKGGNSELWLKLTSEKMEKIRDEWAPTVKSPKLAPIGYELKPLWKLIEGDPATALEDYLVKKWARQAKEAEAKRHEKQEKLRPGVEVNIGSHPGEAPGPGFEAHQLWFVYPKWNYDGYPLASLGLNRDRFTIEHWKSEEPGPICNGDFVRIKVLHSLKDKYDYLYMSSGSNGYYTTKSNTDTTQKWRIWQYYKDVGTKDPILFNGDALHFTNVYYDNYLVAKTQSDSWGIWAGGHKQFDSNWTVTRAD